MPLVGDPLECPAVALLVRNGVSSVASRWMGEFKLIAFARRGLDEAQILHRRQELFASNHSPMLMQVDPPVH
jgi:hypothetical protein